MVNTALAAIVETILLASVFEIHFKSTVTDWGRRAGEGVEGLGGAGAAGEGRAKRLVLFIVDGLRADLLYNVTAPRWRKGKGKGKGNGSESETRAPSFLRRVMEERGSWGVSHTRVPTKSRPGTVALLAGMWEDPATLLTDFNENPFEFDSVFNYVGSTFYFGYPGMKEVFGKSESTRDWVATTYGPETQSLMRKRNISALDGWVLEQTKALFARAATNQTLDEAMRRGKTVFVLYLAGVDLSNHVWDFVSGPVVENVEVVDRIAAETERLVSAYFNDTETAFLLTADHGMTDWGTHGGGSPHETETPLVAWGRGVAAPRTPPPDPPVPPAPPSPPSWKAEGLVRKDANQSDVAVLISALLGLPVPRDSVGVLPRAYLDLPAGEEARALAANALQLLRLSEATGEDARSGLISPVREWEPLPASRVRAHRSRILELRDGPDEDARALINASLAAIEESLESLAFYRGYFTPLLGAAVGAAYLGWAALLAADLLSKLPPPPAEAEAGKAARGAASRAYRFGCDALFLVWSALCSTAVLLEDWPWTFHVYFLLPSFLWWRVARTARDWWPSLKYAGRRGEGRRNARKWGAAVAGSGCLAPLVASFLFARGMSAAGMGAVSASQAAAVWRRWRSLPPLVWASWAGTSLLLGLASQFPVYDLEVDPDLLLGSSLFVQLALFLYLYYWRPEEGEWRSLLAGLLLFLVSCWNALSMRRGAPPSTWRYALSTVILCSGLPLVLLSPAPRGHHRLVRVYLGLAALLVLLSTRHELALLPLFCLHFITWIEIRVREGGGGEGREAAERGEEVAGDRREAEAEAEAEGEASKTKHRHLDWVDLERGALLYFYLVFGFYASGNDCLLSAFSLEWTACLTGSLDVVYMGALVLLKYGLTAFAVLAAFCALFRVEEERGRARGLGREAVTLWVLLLADLVGLFFFLRISNEGTWRDLSFRVASHVLNKGVALLALLWFPLAALLDRARLPSPPYRRFPPALSRAGCRTLFARFLPRRLFRRKEAEPGTRTPLRDPVYTRESLF